MQSTKTIISVIVSFFGGIIVAFISQGEKESLKNRSFTFPEAKKTGTVQRSGIEDNFSRNYINLLDKSSEKLLKLLENPHPKSYKQELASYLEKTQALDIGILSQILENWGKEEGATSLREYEELTQQYPILSSVRQYLKISLLKGWTIQNPEAVALHYKGNIEEYRYTDLISHILETWGTHNPRETLKWYNTLDEKEKNRGTEGLINALIKKKDQNTLREFCASLNKNTGSPSTLEKIATHIIETNDFILIDYFHDQEMRNKLIEQIETSQKINKAYNDYKIQGQISDTLNREEMVQILKKALEESKYLSELKYHFLAFSNSISYEDLNNDTLNYFSQITEHSNFSEFIEFSNKIQDNKLKNSLIKDFLQTKFLTASLLDYSEAIRLTDSITDPQVKRNLVNRIDREFGKVNPFQRHQELLNK